MSDAESTYSKITGSADAFSEGLSILENLYSAGQAYLAGMSRYTTDFYIPYLLASQYFQRVELKRINEESPADTLEAYLHLLENNIELVNRSIKGTADMMSAYAQLEMPDFTEAVQQSIAELKFDKLVEYTKRQAGLMEMVTNSYPESIDAIGSE